MSAPTQSNTEYKKRLITAMLDEPTFHSGSRPPPKVTGRWSPKLVSGVAGLALLSAVGVFLILCQRDISSSSIRTLIEPSEKIAAPASTSRELPSSATAPPAASAAPLDFKLKRSRMLQPVGPVQMRLLRVNTRRRTCDLTLRLDDHRVIQRRLQLKKSSQLGPSSSGTAFQVSISAIERDSVSGTLLSVPAPKKN